MRKLLGIVAGILVAGFVIAAVELIGHRLFPPTAGLDVRTAAGASDYVAGAPAGALLIVVLGWFLGAVLGGWVAVRIARWAAAAWIIAVLIAAGGIYNATQVPAPVWMQLASVLAPALGGFVAHLLARRQAVAGR